MLPKSADAATPAWPSLPPVAHAFAAQLLAWLLTECVRILLAAGPHWAWVSGQGVLAALVGRMFGLPWWWAPINALFVPAALALKFLALAPGWYLAGFAILGAVYWTTFRTRVPLYLSSEEACERVAALLPADRAFSFLDIGCGVGTVLARLAPLFPEGEFRGLEIAPLPFVISWLRARASRRFATRRANFWRENLAHHDVVYAFLSPVPMNDLWRKARAEMRPGSLLVSNTFRIDGVPADSVIPIAGGRRALHVWRM
jgi:SAM-dependent methyltransferase